MTKPEYRIAVSLLRQSRNRFAYPLPAARRLVGPGAVGEVGYDQFLRGRYTTSIDGLDCSRFAGAL